MFDICIAKSSIFTIFQPFLRRLIAADVKVSSRFGNIAKALVFVYIHIAFIVSQFLNDV
jgi:hypothetical protein